MTPEDIALNKQHPARRLGALGFVLAVARWQWLGRLLTATTTSFSHADRYKALTYAIREHATCERVYQGYQYGLAEGRRELGALRAALWEHGRHKMACRMLDRCVCSLSRLMGATPDTEDDDAN